MKYILIILSFLLGLSIIAFIIAAVFFTHPSEQTIVVNEKLDEKMVGVEENKKPYEIPLTGTYTNDKYQFEIQFPADFEYYIETTYVDRFEIFTVYTTSSETEYTNEENKHFAFRYFVVSKNDLLHDHYFISDSCAKNIKYPDDPCSPFASKVAENDTYYYFAAGPGDGTPYDITDYVYANNFSDILKPFDPVAIDDLLPKDERTTNYQRCSDYRDVEVKLYENLEWGDENYFNGRIVCENDSQEEVVLVPRFKDRLPFLNESWNLTLFDFAYSERQKAVYLGVYADSADGGIEKVLKYFVEQDRFEVANINNRHLRWTQHDESISPDGKRMITAIDTGLHWDFVLLDFESDTYETIVFDLNENETLADNCSGFGLGLDIKWLDDITVQYAVREDVYSCSQDENRLIEHRTISFPFEVELEYYSNEHSGREVADITIPKEIAQIDKWSFPLLLLDEREDGFLTLMYIANCCHGNIYSIKKYDIENQSVEEMEISDVVKDQSLIFHGSLSPDRTKYASISAEEINVVDLAEDEVIKTIPAPEPETFFVTRCTLGCYTEIEWIDNKTLEYGWFPTIQDVGDIERLGKTTVTLEE